MYIATAFRVNSSTSFVSASPNNLRMLRQSHVQIRRPSLPNPNNEKGRPTRKVRLYSSLVGLEARQQGQRVAPLAPQPPRRAAVI